MKIKYSEENKKVNSKKKSKEPKSPIPFFINFIVIVTGVLLTLSMTVWFNAENFSVSGETVYSDDEILFSTGLFVGDNMVRMDKSAVSKSVCEKLPYIKSCKLGVRLPNTLSISVEPATEYAYFIKDSKIYITDKDFKVLNTSTNTDRQFPVIKGISADETVVGKTIDFKDKEQKETLDEIFECFESNGLDVTYIDVSNTVSVKLFAGDNVYVEFGNNANIPKKSAHLKKMLEDSGTDKMVRISFEGWTESNRKATLTYEDVRNFKN